MNEYLILIGYLKVYKRKRACAENTQGKYILVNIRECTIMLQPTNNTNSTTHRVSIRPILFP